MQNLTVSSQLVAQKNNAQAPTAASNADPASNNAATDEAPESAANVFGKILAQQVAMSKPSKDEALVTALKDRAKDTDASDGATAVDAANQILYLDPNALPMQKFLASNANSNAASKSAFADGVPSAMSAISGKELPVGNGKSAGVAALTQGAQAPDVSDQADATAVDQSFGLLLADKQQSSSPTDVSTEVNPAMSAVQTQANTVTDVKAPSDQSLSVPQKVGAEDWGTGLGDKVVWMVGNQTRGAEIHLNPPALGPLEVRVSITDGQANLSFMTHHAAVREALEAATPRLREMLGDNGISMGSVSVDVGSFAQQQSQQQQASSSNGSSGSNAWFTMPGETDSSVNTFTTFVQPGRGRGAVDYFA